MNSSNPPGAIFPSQMPQQNAALLPQHQFSRPKKGIMEKRSTQHLFPHALFPFFAEKIFPPMRPTRGSPFQ